MKRSTDGVKSAPIPTNGHSNGHTHENDIAKKNPDPSTTKPLLPAISPGPIAVNAASSSEAPSLLSSDRVQLRQLLQTIKAVRRGDFSVRFPIQQEGLISEIGEVLNDVIDLNENMAN